MREADVFQAAKNDLVRRRDALVQEIRNLDDEIAMLARIQQRRGDSGEDIPPIYPTGEFGRGAISSAIRRWMKDAGKQAGDFFTAKEVTNFLKTKGYTSQYVYNSTFEALKRMVASGELVKVEGGFQVAKKVGE